MAERNEATNTTTILAVILDKARIVVASPTSLNAEFNSVGCPRDLCDCY